MTDKDRAAQVWKGPYKCRECGNAFHGIVLETAKKQRWHFTTFSGPHKECTGELVPYDRRHPSQVAYGQEWYRAGIKKMWDVVAAMWNTMQSLDELDEAANKLFAEQGKK